MRIYMVLPTQSTNKSYCQLLLLSSLGKDYVNGGKYIFTNLYTAGSSGDRTLDATEWHNQ